MQQLAYQPDAGTVAWIVTALFVVLIGVGIMLYERFEGASRRLALMSAITGIGLVCFAMVEAAAVRTLSLVWFRVGLAVFALLPPALYMLAVDLVQAARPRTVRIAWGAGVGLFLWTLLSPTVTEGVISIYQHVLIANGGWAGLIYVAFLAGYLVATIVALIRSYRSARSSRERRRAVTLALAFGVGSLALLDFFTAVPLGWGASRIAIPACMLILGYAAVRYRAFARLSSFATDRILDVMGDGMLLVDGDGRIQTANRAALEMSGRDLDDVVGLPLAGLIEAPDGREPALDHMRDCRMRLLRPDGHRIEVSVSSEALRQRGEAVGRVLVIRDIRDRLRAAEELQATEERYQSLFWNNPGLAYEVDIQGTIVRVNRTVEQALGMNAEDLVGRSFGELVYPADRERAEATFSRVIQGQSQEIQLRVMLEGGGTIEVRGLSVPVTRDGEVVGIFGVALDLTEEERIKRELELQRLEFVELFEGSPEAILIADEHDVVMRVNPEFTRTFGYEEREAVGRNVDDLLVPDELKQEGASLTGAARSGEIVRTETIRRRKDGTLVDVSLLARELRLPGRAPQLYGIYRDITDRRKAERRLRERETELRHAQRLEAVGKLAGGVAHDFNNLVTVISGHVDFAMDELPESHPVRADLEEIGRAGERAAKLTQQLLAFSRRQVLRPEMVDAAAVIADVRQMLGRLIGEHIRFEIAHEGHAHVLADRGQLEQVLVNLVVNARDAMSEGGHLTITTDHTAIKETDPAVEGWAVTPGEYVRITVRDTGIGMDADTRARAFDPFYTTKERGKGTGLGLSTVFGIVKQSGGHITAESEPGRGTAIRMWLPAAVPEVGQAPGPPAMESTADLAPDGRHGGGATVLVVEDEDALRDLAARVLRKAGHEVVTAQDGMEGFDLAANRNLDLLLTDLVMPRMGGRELARRLRALQPDLPILFMSGYDDEISAADPDEDFLPKPFTPAQLAARVDAALAVRKAD